ncbi:MAG: Ni/Fe hydrogenase subunit alpha [Planctomycetaceae bacterium]|nr:Ni/Fe hydrogenase subunit alpha [Planctomycetaceae bacterium]
MSDDSWTIRVGTLTRVEGEGALNVRLRDGHVETVELNIYEPPRFFEAFLRGRPLEDVPDITARICGICPVAYQMSAVHALEAALEIEITPEIRELRRLLYCGEWIESHTLHMHLLHAPDFHGCASGLELARLFPREVQRGLRLKKIGNRLLEILGGRSVHPINVCVGGFYRSPQPLLLQELIPDLEWGVTAAAEATRWVAGFPFPDFVRDYDLIALTPEAEYPFHARTFASSKGTSFSVAEYEKVLEEHQVPHSTALQARRRENAASCLFGPLARIHLNFEHLHPEARTVAEECGIEWPCRNPFQSIVARGIEVVQAFAEALRIIRAYTLPRQSRIPYEPRAGVGMAATEAPRGTLYHRYEVDEAGRIAQAVIIPPTSQNQQQIEEDLREYLPRLLTLEHAEIADHCERLIRTYDPCISCATHFLKFTLERDDSPHVPPDPSLPPD